MDVLFLLAVPLAAWGAWRFLRARATARPEPAEALSQAERDRLDQIMRD